MIELYYKNKKNIYGIQNPELFIKIFFKEVIPLLEEFGLKVIINNNSLNFRRKISFTTHTGKNVRELFILIREGEITLKQNENNIEINYKTNFMQHLFTSIVGGVIINILLAFQINLKILIIVKIFLIIVLPIIVLGYVLMKYIMDDIIKTAVKEGLSFIK